MGSGYALPPGTGAVDRDLPVTCQIFHLHTGQSRVSAEFVRLSQSRLPINLILAAHP